MAKKAYILPEKTYTIEYREKTKSFIVSADSEVQKRIIKLLVNEPCFVEIRNVSKVGTKNYLELDNRALEILLEKEVDANLKMGKSKFTPDVAAIRRGAVAETAFAAELENEDYDLSKRIWKEEGKGYFCEVRGSIYNNADLGSLVDLVKGDKYFVQKNKPITSLSPNPVKFFGVFDLIRDAVSSNKSIIHLNTRDKNGKRIVERKKKFEPLIANVDQYKMRVEGADAAENMAHSSAESSALSHQDSAMIEGMLIFPVFLRGAFSSYQSLKDEIKDAKELVAQQPLKIAALQAKLDNFRKELCELSGLDYDTTLQDSPQQLVVKVGKKLEQIKNEVNSAESSTDVDLGEAAKNEKLNKIVQLCNEYQQHITKEISSPKEWKILAAYEGWLATVGVMATIGTYELQAAINMIHGVHGLSEPMEEGGRSLLTDVGTYFGFGAQVLTAVYAIYKTTEEGKEWSEVAKELREFKKVENVSELARQISTKMKEGERDFHRAQTFGHAALAIGQSLMAVGGHVGLRCDPMSYAGLGITAGAVLVNTVSDLKYKWSYAIDKRPDKIESAILSAQPKFDTEDVTKIEDSLSKHVQQQIFALEMLGHLRAPQLVLYEKFLEENKDDKGILARGAALMGGERIMRWMKNPPQDSISLVVDNKKIRTIENHPNNLDIFWVEETDTSFIWKISGELSKLHSLRSDGGIDAGKVKEVIDAINQIRKEEYGNGITNLEVQDYSDISGIHKAAVKMIQADFIDKKYAKAQAKAVETGVQSVKEICRNILANDGEAAVYLKKKLLRAAANGQLSYELTSAGIAHQTTKNGKPIIVRKFDLEGFKEAELESFLTDRRKQKGVNPLSSEKKSVLAKAVSEELPQVRSEHLRPFNEIAKLSLSTQEFFSTFAEEEKKEEQEEAKRRQALAAENAARALRRREAREEYQMAIGNSIDIDDYEEDEKQDSSLDDIKIVKLEDEGHKNNPKQLKLLRDLHDLVNKSSDEQRGELSKQNQAAMNATQESRPFICKHDFSVSSVDGEGGGKTVRVYVDPDHQDSEEHQIVAILDHDTNQTEVFYGPRARAFVVRRANKIEKNAFLATMGHQEILGNKKSDEFVFKKISEEIKKMVQKINLMNKMITPSSVIKDAVAKTLQPEHNRGMSRGGVNESHV